MILFLNLAWVCMALLVYYAAREHMWDLCIGAGIIAIHLSIMLAAFIIREVSKS